MKHTSLLANYFSYCKDFVNTRDLKHIFDKFGHDCNELKY